MFNLVVSTATFAQDYSGRYYGTVRYRGIYGDCLKVMTSNQAAVLENIMVAKFRQIGLDPTGVPFLLKIKRDRKGRYSALFNNKRVPGLRLKKSTFTSVLYGGYDSAPMVTDYGVYADRCYVSLVLVLTVPRRGRPYGGLYVDQRDCVSGMPWCAFDFSGPIRRSSLK
jgi:hypothetical protein